MRGLDLSSCWMSFNVFSISSFVLCVIARIPYAAGGLEQQVVEPPPQNYSVAKILKTARLQGPVFRVPKSAENRLRSKVPPEFEDAWLRERQLRLSED